MTDDSFSHTPKETAEARAAEAAAIRRRWITLGEVLAVLAVLISALTLWNSWSERSEDQSEKAEASKREIARSTKLTLRAQTDGNRLTVGAASSEQAIQSQTIIFPSMLEIAPVETTGDSRIEANWFAAALKDARDKAGLPDDSRGDERLPVLIETSFLSDGEAHTDAAIYDIGYTIEGKLLGGHSVTLRGLSLLSRPAPGKGKADLDARWAQLTPEKKRK